MQACIVVKGKQFRHQFLYTGIGDERHCHFCQLTYPSLQDLEKAQKEAKEDYPGQNYFHENNVNIKTAEERWEKNYG